MKTPPVGLLGLLMISTLVRGVTLAASSSRSMLNLRDSRSGTGTGTARKYSAAAAYVGYAGSA